MAIESWGFALITAVVGMATVFAFLILLSLLMAVMRRLLDQEPDGGETGRKRSGASRAPEGAGATAGGTAPGGQGRPGRHAPAEELSGGVPRWVSAAVLAYLCEEERAYRPRATGWTDRRTT